MERDLTMTGKHWTKTQKKLLKQWYKTKTDKEVAELLGRTAKGVMQKRWMLGLDKKTNDPLTTIMERQRILLEGK